MRKLQSSLALGIPKLKRKATVIDPLLNELTEEELDKYGEAFDEFDELGDGRIPIRKLGALMDKCETPMSDRAIEDHLRALDIFETEDQCISRGGFIRLMAHRQKELRLVGVDIDVDPTERGNTVVFEDSIDDDEPGDHLTCFQKAFGYGVLAAADWFGARHFDFDGDGDVDWKDVEEFLNSERKWEFVKTSFGRGRKNKKVGDVGPTKTEEDRAKQELKEQVKEAKRLLDSISLENIAGDWIVGNPGQDFVVTIEPNGMCLYDGVHMGEANDIVETGFGRSHQITRQDGWTLNRSLSTLLLLVWESEGQKFEWRRIPGIGDLSLSTLMGDWRIKDQEGNESADRVEVREEGKVFFDGDYEPEQDIIMSAPSVQGYPEVSRAEWVLDMRRSNAEMLVWWTNMGDGVFELWRRPPSKQNAEGMWQSIQSALPGNGSILQGIDALFDNVEDLLDNSDAGSSHFEGDEKEAVMNMFTDQWLKPKFVVTQVVVCFAFWAIFAIKFWMDNGGVPTALATKAGLDSLFEGMTDLRLNEADCTSYRFQAWRWLSYQFTHVGASHILMNCLLTVVLGIPLEALCGPFKMCLMFNNGVVGGAWGYAILDGRATVVGMSGGCYALIGIHFAQIFLNWRSMRFRGVKVFTLLTLLFLENLNQFFGGVSQTVRSSFAAHAGGLIAGFLIGINFAYNDELTKRDKIARVVITILGCVVSVFCIVWILTNQEPYPMPDWFGEREYMYMFAQVFNKRCVGEDWRCVRCACKDEVCRTRLTSLPAWEQRDVTVGGWWQYPASGRYCTGPWFGYTDGLANDKALNTTSMMEFIDIPLYDGNHPCSVNIR